MAARTSTINAFSRCCGTPLKLQPSAPEFADRLTPTEAHRTLRLLAGHHPAGMLESTWERSVALVALAICTGHGIAALDLAITLFVAGVVYPGLVTRWASIRLWWHHGRVYRRLAPLWTALHTAFPEDALERTPVGRRWDVLSPRSVHRRYYRRIIECRDGLVRISPYLALEAATADADAPLPRGRGAPSGDRAAGVRLRRGREPSQAVPVALPEGGVGGLEDDVRQLTRLSEALAAHS